LGGFDIIGAEEGNRISEVLDGGDNIGAAEAGVFDSDQVAGGGNEDDLEDVGVAGGTVELSASRTSVSRVLFGFVFWGEEDVNEDGFGVGFLLDAFEDVLGLVDIEGGDFVRNSGEGLEFFFEGLV